MRRKDREVKDKIQIQAVIEACKVCRIAMWDKEKQIPYIVPVNFGYSWEEEELKLYFHSAKQGRKLELLAQNDAVAFELDCEHQLIEGESSCSYGYRFQSVMGEGAAYKIESVQEKKAALARLMQHMTGKKMEAFEEKMVTATEVFCVTASQISCKIHE